MQDGSSNLFHPRRQVILAAVVFSVLALLLNTATFVNWAREAPFPPGVTEWLIEQADRIHALGQGSGFSWLFETVQSYVADLRDGL